MKNSLSVAIELIEAQQRLLSLFYKIEGKQDISEMYLMRFDRAEKEVKRLTDLFWQMQIPIHTINQKYNET